MQLTISTTHQPTSDLGYLLHKHPAKIQTFSVTSGKAHVFYPELTPEKATATLLLDIDTIGLVRTLKVPGNSLMLSHYVNDRPYTASSFLSHTIAKVYGSALNGNCKDRPELVNIAMPFEVKISVIKIVGGEALLQRIFLPLGYEVMTTRHILDEKFTEWGESNYYTITLKNTLTLQQLLSHLYVLLPVFDNEKHYWVSKHDIEKLLKHGENWLSEHPEKELITKRYLRYIKNLTRMAFERLNEEDEKTEEVEVPKTIKEKRISMHQKRLNAALEQLKASGAKTVIDLGCGEGKLLKMLMPVSQFDKITGMDVSFYELKKAKDRLYYDRLSERQQEKLTLFQGSLTYRDERIEGYDAAAIIEVIEHLDIERLTAFEEVVFGYAKPKMIVLTTPNAEYNEKYAFLNSDEFRHTDHRFEWTRQEFEQWTTKICEKYDYQVDIHPIGEIDEKVGASSQMGVFSLV